MAKNFNMSVEDDEVLNFSQCMKLTGFSKGLLYKMTSQRTIPHYKKSKFVLFRKSEIIEWLFADKVKTKEEEAKEVETIVSNKKKVC